MPVGLKRGDVQGCGSRAINLIAIRQIINLHHSFLLAIINGAKAITGGAEDRQTLANKTDVGMYYALEQGLNNYTDWAKDVMSGVNSNASSVTDANTKTDHYAVLATDPATSDLVVKLVGVYEG